MTLKLLILSLLVIQTQANLKCRFGKLGSSYTCFLTIYNPLGLDNFTSIDGIHQPGLSNSDVIFIQLDMTTQSVTKNIPSVFCRIFPNLVQIWIFDNQVEEIGPDSFRFCQNLRDIQLRNNTITRVAERAFDHNPNLIFINLMINQISELPLGIFRQVTRLRDLDIDTNKLKVIHSNWFSPTQRLDILFLDENETEAVDERIFDYGISRWIRFYGNRCASTTEATKQNMARCFENYRNLN